MQHLGGSLIEIDGIDIPARFTRPAASHRAVRAGVGVTRHPWGVMTIEGSDREEFLNDTITCNVPPADGDVRYGFLLDPDGTIEADMYVTNAEEQYVCLTAPGTVSSLATTLNSRTFIQDVAVDDVTDDFVVFGLHGPAAATKLASVMPEGTPPPTDLRMDRGVVREQGVTVIRLDAPTGEVGYVVLCREADGAAVFDALVNLGAVATPFGYDTWRGLTLEAGTPLFDTELAGRTPNECGQLHAGVALDKGCFVGQEAVARVVNLSMPRRWLFGLTAVSLPDGEAPVSTPSDRDGLLTRSTSSPILESALGMAFLPNTVEIGTTVHVGQDAIEAKVVPLPFIEGSEGSRRCPQYSSSPA